MRTGRRGLFFRRRRSVIGVVIAVLAMTAVVASPAGAEPGDPTGSIQGTVVDAVTGAPLAGVCVYVSGEIGGSSAVTAADGTYEVTGLPTDSYLVDFFGRCAGPYAEEFYDSVPFTQGDFLDRVRLVPVIDGQPTRGIDATLDRAGTFEGTVTNARTGRPLADVCINIVDPSGLAGLGTTTDGDGRYSLPANLTTYTLIVNERFEGCGFGGDSYKAAFGQASAGPFTIGAAQVVTTDFALAPITPTSPADCKGGGWSRAFTVDGSPFKNQGACVSYLNRR